MKEIREKLMSLYWLENPTEKDVDRVESEIKKIVLKAVLDMVGEDKHLESSMREYEEGYNQRGANIRKGVEL